MTALQIPQDELRRALRMVLPVAGRNRLPILTGVHFEVKQRNVKITCSDLDLTIAATFNADVAVPGEFVVPAKLLAEWVERCTDHINVTVDEDVLFKSGRSQARFKLLPIEEWPKLPFKFDSETLRLDETQIDLVRRVMPFASDDAKRGVLTALHFIGTTVEATDSVSAARAHLEDADLPDRNLPAAGMATALADAKEAVMRFGPHHAVVAHSRCTWTMTLVAGLYPSLDKMFAERPVRLSFDTDELLAAVQKVMPMDDGSRAVHIVRNDAEATLSVERSDVGRIEDVVACEGDYGKPLTVQGRYLQQAITSVRAEQMQLELTDDELHPFVVRGENIAVLVVPIRAT